MSPRIRAYLYLFFATLIWGYAGVVIKQTLNEISPLSFLSYRFFLASLFMVPVVIVKKLNFPKKAKDVINLILLSLLGMPISLGLLFYGFKLTTVSDAGIIGATIPIMTVFAGVIFLRERVTKQEKIGILITLIGLAALTIQPAFEFQSGISSRILGNFLLILSNLAVVAWAILSKESLRAKIDPFLITTVGFVIGFVTITPFAIFRAKSLTNIIIEITNASVSSHLAVLYMAIFSSAIAYWFWQKGLKSIEVSEAALFDYLTAIFTIIFAIIFLGEAITTPFIVGTIILVSGIILAEWKKKRYTK